MQHSVAPSGRQANLAGLWHSAQPIAGRHRASAKSRRRVIGIAVTLLVGLALVGHMGWLVFTHSSAAPRQYPAFTRTQRHAAAAADDWIRANLPTGIRLLADGFDPPAGYPPVLLATAGANWSGRFSMPLRMGMPLWNLSSRWASRWVALAWCGVRFCCCAGFTSL